MSEVALVEQLDLAIEAMLRKPDAPLPDVEAQVGALLTIAAELRDLPRADFKARLKKDLERETSMSTATETRQSADQSAHSKVREGFRTVTPYVVVSDVHQ